MDTDDTIDTVFEKVDQRAQWRRAEDWKQRMLIAGLAVALVSGGIAWGTATAAVAQKVDRTEFFAHVSASDRRFLADSIERAHLNTYITESLHRIELKQDSTNGRLQQVVCDRKPASCR